MLTIIGEHFLYIIVTLAVICVGGAVFKKAFWLISVVTTLIYLSSMYSSGWNQSGKDYRSASSRLKRGETEELEYKIYDGFVYALPLLVLSVVMYVVYLIVGVNFMPIFRLYNFYFANLFDKVGVAGEILATILPYVAYGVGYIIGKSKKTFIVQHISKLVYQKQKEKDTKKSKKSN